MQSSASQHEPALPADSSGADLPRSMQDLAPAPAAADINKADAAAASSVAPAAAADDDHDDGGGGRRVGAVSNESHGTSSGNGSSRSAFALPTAEITEALLPGDATSAPPATRPEAAAAHSAARPKGSRKLLLILHGKRIDDEQIRQAITALKEEGHQVQVRVTFDSGDVDQFVKEALELWDQQQYDTLVAGGGDGTLNELVAALLKHQQQQQPGRPQHAVTIAQLPLGTANDLASATGISLDPLDALRLARDPSSVHPVDVALVNGEVFMNLATAGPVSEVNSKDMSGAMKKLLGPTAVAVAGLRQLFITGLQPIRGVRITFPTTMTARHDSHTPDQVATLTGDLLVLAAGQARQMGRMVNICPEALLDDGLLDFTIGFGSAWSQVTALASDMVSSGAQTSTARDVKLLRLPWLILEADCDIKCNRDGEPSPPSKRLVFEVLPRRINMHLPDSRLLLADKDPAAAAAVDAAASATGGEGAAGSKQHSRHHKHVLQKISKKLMSTGHKPTRQLLRALWQAQQPPGRLSRFIPRLRKLLSRTLVYAGLLAAGFALGYNAQQMVDLGGLPGMDRGSSRAEVQEEKQLLVA